MVDGRIIRLEIEIGPPTNFTLYGDPLAVAARGERVVEFWCPNHADGQPPRGRTFMLAGTGQPIVGEWRHWGTVVVPLPDDRRAVWHLIELMH